MSKAKQPPRFSFTINDMLSLAVILIGVVVFVQMVWPESEPAPQETAIPEASPINGMDGPAITAEDGVNPPQEVDINEIAAKQAAHPVYHGRPLPESYFKLKQQAAEAAKQDSASFNPMMPPPPPAVNTQEAEPQTQEN